LKNFIGTAFRSAFPGWALKRRMKSMALRQLEQYEKRSGTFDATRGGRTRYDFLTNSSSPDSAIVGNISGLRQHVRQLEFNNGRVAGIIKRIKNNVVGKGFTLQSTVKADEAYARQEFPRISEETAQYINTNTEKYFGQWAKQADVQLTHMFHEICGLAEMSMVRDGEALIVARESANQSRLIPYCLQGYEPDRLQTPMSEISNPKIRHGIEYDEEGVPKTFFILRSHPGESFLPALKRNDFEEVPAFFKNGRKKVFHLFDPIRFEQTRGFSELAAGLKSLQDADRYMEAEKFAALMAACSVVTYKSNNPQGAIAGISSSDEDSNKIFDFAPGAQWNITDDEEVKWNDPKRPNSNMGEYIDQLMKDPSGALDVPPEVLSQSWSGINYSNARTILLQFYLTCSLRQFYLINHLCDPAHEGAFYSMVSAGVLRIAGFEKRPYDFMRHTWIPNGWQWVDPLKESQAAANDVDNGFSDPYTVNSSRGQDADEVLERIARYLKRKKDLEEKHGIQFPAKEGAAVQDEPEQPAKEKKSGRRAFLQSV
jgi:lambda family phage portal protein